MNEERERQKALVQEKLDRILAEVQSRGLTPQAVAMPEESAGQCRCCGKKDINAGYTVGIYASQVPLTSIVAYTIAMTCLVCADDQKKLFDTMTILVLKQYFQDRPSRNPGHPIHQN